MHGKTLYSNEPNSGIPNDPGCDDWDITGDPQEYYGAGLFDVSGTNIEITYNTDDNTTMNSNSIRGGKHLGNVANNYSNRT